jgi:hypothetical protein
MSCSSTLSWKYVPETLYQVLKRYQVPDTTGWFHHRKETNTTSERVRLFNKDKSAIFFSSNVKNGDKEELIESLGIPRRL